MNVVRISCVLLYFAFPGDCIDSLSWVDSLIEYIAECTNARQVILMSNLAPTERIESRIIDKLFVKIVQNIPTVRMNIVGLHDPKGLLPHISNEENSAVGDTSTTFFIFVHESREKLGFLPPDKIIDVFLGISASKNRSKFLVVLVSPVLRDGLEDLLQHAWIRQLLDFTLVELTEVQAPEKLIGIDYSNSDTIPIIHQLNLFKKVYTRKNWTSSVEWFPDKVGNMWGHPLKIGVVHQPPFSWVVFDKYERPVRLGGANIDLLKTIARLLNFSMNYQRNLNTFMEINVDKTPTGIYNLMRSDKIDLLSYLSPHYTADDRHYPLRTASIRLDKLCSVVPVLPRLTMPFPMDFFEAYLASFVIVTLFWILKRALRFKGNLWKPFNIVRVLFGISVARRPTKISECLLFACLLLVSAIYSSNIYIALTNISLQANAEMEFDSFEDLENSGLTPMISSYFYNKTFDKPVGPLIDLKRRSLLQTAGMHMCPLMAATNKNITCIMSYEEAKIWVRQIDRRPGGKLKITKACFWSDSTSFLLRLGSPYRSRINEVLGRIQSSGLLERLYNDRNTNFSSDSDSESVEEKAGLDTRENMKALRHQLLVISIVGYTISLLTFVAEILVDRALKYKRRNVNLKKVES